MFRARIFRGNSGPAQNMASRLDETQHFASRLSTRRQVLTGMCQISEKVVSPTIGRAAAAASAGTGSLS